MADHGGLSGLSDPDHDHGTSLTAVSLLDDDHTQYALLAGRGTSQTLNGGLNAGNDLTLLGTAHATPGSVFIQSSGIFEMDGASGQLKLPTTGSSAGLLVGGDVQLYRTAANVWSSPDSMRLGGYLGLGTESAPSNTTAGDVTGLRGHFGTDAVFTSGISFEVNAGRVQIGGALTLSASAYAFAVNPTVAASESARGFQSTPTFTVAATMSFLWGTIFQPSVSVASAQTLTVYEALAAQCLFSGNDGAISFAAALRAYGPSASGTLKPATNYGVVVADQGLSGITTAIGVSITKPTGATNNYYMEFGTATADVNVAIGSNVSVPVIVGGVARKLYFT